MMPILRNLITILFFLPLFSWAGELYEEFPHTIKSSEKYVFYSHGYIVEGENPKPVHPKWGVYDFPRVKQELMDEGYNLVAYHRPANTSLSDYSKKLANEVRTLIRAGVQPENITLLGFSRGGAISILASNELKNGRINLAILAGCSEWINKNPEIQVYGDVLSIFETSDSVGSCQPLIDRSGQVTSFKEIAISTGKEHGAFYLPRAEWLGPVKAWIKQPKRS